MSKGRRSGGQTKDGDGSAPHQGATPAEVARLLELLITLTRDTPVAQLIEAASNIPQQIAQSNNRKRTIQWRAQRANYQYIRSTRLFFLAGLVICLAFIGGVVWVFRDDKDTLLPVLTALIGLLAGAGGGFIFGQRPRGEGQS